MITTRIFDENLKAYDKGYRTIINRGGTRSSKSYSILQLLILIACKKEKIITVVSRTLPHLKGGVVRDIENILRELGIIVEFCHHVSDKYFKIGKSKIEYFGVDDLDRVYGPSRDILFVNEAPFIDFQIFNQLAIRTTETIFIDFNPINKFWLETEGIEYEATSKVITSTYIDNIDNLSDPQKLEIEKNKQKAVEGDPYWQNWWNIYGLGIYSNIKLGSEFVHQFNRTRHVGDCEPDYAIPFHFSFDQNVVPYISCLVHQVVKEGDIYIVRVVDEITGVNPYNNTENLCSKIISYYPQMEKCYVYGDATGKKRDTRGRENDYDIIERVLKKYLSNKSMRVPPGNPSVNKSRDFINKIYAGGFQIKIVISPRCVHFIDDLENVKEDVDGGMLKEVYRDKFTGQSYERYGHMLDAHRYFLCEAFRSYFYN